MTEDEQDNHLRLTVILKSSKLLLERNLHFPPNALLERRVEFLKAVF